MRLIILFSFLSFAPGLVFPQSGCVPTIPRIVEHTSTRLASINSLNEETHLISIQKIRTENSIQFIATGGGRVPLYSGDNYADLVQSVRPAKISGKKVYYDLHGFSENDEMTFSNSIDLQRADVQATTWRREVFPEAYQDAYLGELKNVEDINISPISSVNRVGRPFYKVIVDYISKKKRNFIEFLSTSRKAVAEFASSLNTRLLRAGSVENWTTSDIVAIIKKDISKKYSLDKKDILTRFRLEEFQQALILKIIQSISPRLKKTNLKIEFDFV